jgi:hypothetical protein
MISYLTSFLSSFGLFGLLVGAMTAWSGLVKVYAMNCANPANTLTCGRMSVRGYPTIQVRVNDWGAGCEHALI